MRLTAVNLILIAGLLGGVGGWVMRQGAGLSGPHAAAIARTWLIERMGYDDVEVLTRQRFAKLEGYPGPVYAVSTRASTQFGGQRVLMCWGVVVDVRTEQVLGGVGGEIPWLKCA